MGFPMMRFSDGCIGGGHHWFNDMFLFLM